MNDIMGLNLNELLLAGRVAKNARIANENADEIDRLRAYIHQLESAIRNKDELLKQWTDHANEQEMIVSGREKIIAYFKQVYSNDPILNKARKTYKDGSPLYGINELFIMGFDAKGKELGIENPEKLRKS